MDIIMLCILITSIWDIWPVYVFHHGEFLYQSMRMYLCIFMKVGLMDMIIICYDHMLELIELKRDQTSDQNHRQ